MNNKRWFLSKIVWVNAIAFIGIMVQEFSGKTILTPELQVMALSVVNLFLRSITHENIVW